MSSTLDSQNDVGDESSPKIVFKSPEDKVVSEVNTFLVQAEQVKPIQKSSNRIAKLQFTLPESSPFGEKEKNIQSKVNITEEDGLNYDSDGDLVLKRQIGNNREDAYMLIEYENATTIGMVGLQVWRGAFLLADFILHFSEKYFKGNIVAELGAGTGLAGIIASAYAKKVILTDLNEPNILDLIRANVSHNKKFVKGEIVVTPLDFMDLQWSSELTNLVNSANVFLIADVVYHVDITSAFVKTLKKILSESTQPKDFFIAMEKRYLFTISDLDTAAPMYCHFLEEIDEQIGLSPGALPKPIGNFNLSMKIYPLDFPQYFNYERIKELVLFHLQLK